MFLTVMYLGSTFVMRNIALSFMRIFFILKNMWFDQLVRSNGVVIRFSRMSGIVLTSHCILLSKVLVNNSNNNSK